VVTLKNTVSGINNSFANNRIKMYPNPATNKVAFSEVIDAEFYNIAGQKVLTVINSSSADLSSLPKGIYQVKVNQGLSYKLVKK
jgi:hypothetical protein